MNDSTGKYPELVLIGASAGGIQALKKLLPALNEEFPFAVVIILHRLKNVVSSLNEVLQHLHPAPVQEIFDKQSILPGTIYIAPANYHLLLEKDRLFCLSYDEPVNFSRPSIDVTFASAAESHGPATLGILLTGANADGAYGLLRIMESGGEAWVQDPEEAEVSRMPEAGIQTCPDARVMTLDQMAAELNKRCNVR